MADAEDRISWFPVPDEADLPPELQGLFRAARERIGFVPNVFRTYAFRPERLSAWCAQLRMLHGEAVGRPCDGRPAPRGRAPRGGVDGPPARDLRVRRTAPADAARVDGAGARRA